MEAHHEGDLETAAELHRPVSVWRWGQRGSAHRRAVDSSDHGLANGRHAATQILEVATRSGACRVEGGDVVEIGAGYEAPSARAGDQTRAWGKSNRERRDD